MPVFRAHPVGPVLEETLVGGALYGFLLLQVSHVGPILIDTLANVGLVDTSDQLASFDDVADLDMSGNDTAPGKSLGLHQRLTALNEDAPADDVSGTTPTILQAESKKTRSRDGERHPVTRLDGGDQAREFVGGAKGADCGSLAAIVQEPS